MWRGLDGEAIRWQAELQEARIRMEALLQKRIADEAAGTDWTVLAREHYAANRENFESPERASAAHILIRIEDRSEEEARQLAEEIARRAREGEDFSALATEYSEDPSAAQNQGDLGYFQRGQMVPEFEKAVFAMDTEGEIAGPLKSQFGYHVIRYQGRRDARVRPFDEVRDSIIRDLRQRQANEVREAEVARVRADEGIVVDHEAVDALEAEYRTVSSESIRERREQSGGR
jgi:peptidyl-prolyl cis-trans isomerase C